MNDEIGKLEKAKNVARTLSHLVSPTAKYVYKRRGRFSAAGTALALYPFLRRPHHTWAEFEKDFRMYDQMNGRKTKA